MATTGAQAAIRRQLAYSKLPEELREEIGGNATALVTAAKMAHPEQPFSEAMAREILTAVYWEALDTMANRAAKAERGGRRHDRQ
jgi:hypothetical protein